MATRLTATETFTTTATPIDVWMALATPRRWPEVLPDLREGLIEPPGILADGAAIRTFARPGSKAVDMTYHVVAAETGRRLAFWGESRHWRSETEFSIEGMEAARVTLSVSIEPLGFWPPLAVRLWRGIYQQQAGTNLRARTQAMLRLAETVARERTQPAS